MKIYSEIYKSVPTYLFLIKNIIISRSEIIISKHYLLQNVFQFLLEQTYMSDSEKRPISYICRKIGQFFIVIITIFFIMYLSIKRLPELIQK